MNSLKQIETCCINEHKDGHFSVYSDIMINAPKEDVWRVLSDFENMNQWSSTMVNITGEIKDKGNIQSHFSFEGQIWVADPIFHLQGRRIFWMVRPLNRQFQWQSGQPFI